MRKTPTHLRKSIWHFFILMLFTGNINYADDLKYPRNVFPPDRFKEAVASAKAQNLPLAFVEVGVPLYRMKVEPETEGEKFKKLVNRHFEDLNDFSVVVTFHDRSVDGTFNHNQAEYHISPLIETAFSNYEGKVKPDPDLKKTNTNFMHIVFSNYEMTQVYDLVPYFKNLTKKELEACKNNIRQNNSLFGDLETISERKILLRFRQIELRGGFGACFKEIELPDENTSKRDIKLPESITKIQYQRSPTVKFLSPGTHSSESEEELVFMSPGNIRFIRLLDRLQNRKLETWVNSEGKEITAKFHSLNGETLGLEGANGKVIYFNVNLLSEESKTLAKDLAKRFPQLD